MLFCRKSCMLFCYDLMIMSTSFYSISFNVKHVFLWASQLKNWGSWWDFKPFSQEIVKFGPFAASKTGDCLELLITPWWSRVNQQILATWLQWRSDKNIEGWKVVTIPGFVQDISISYIQFKSCLVSVFHGHYLLMNVMYQWAQELRTLYVYVNVMLYSGVVCT